MRATLEFNLPEEDALFLAAAHAGELASALSEIAEHLRNREKHGGLGEEAAAEVSKARRVVAEVLESLPEALRL